MSRRPLLVTVDVECDKGPDWRTASPLRFDGVARGIGERLHPLCEALGARPTYLLSPEVLCDPASVALLRELRGCELGTHLHGEYVAPGLRSLEFAGQRTDDMQWEYGSDRERDKLATLTELFRQQIGRAPRSFRAGRFGVGPDSGRHLLELGYLCDSSVTPFVQWTSQRGERRPDFRGAPTAPYFVDRSGDLLRAGASALLEVPVTIRQGTDGGDPVWLRPWYSDRDQLLALIDRVAAEGADAPLCMMFHNVEWIAGGSPYPQTDADVARYADDFRAAIEHALRRGFTPMTMAEAQLDALDRRLASAGGCHPVWRDSGSPRPRAMRFPAQAVHDAVAASGTQPWHGYAHEHRTTRWDLTEPYSWLADHVAKDGPVLDVGCGIGTNLQYLAEQGFTDLDGYDLDAAAIGAGRDLLPQHGHRIRLWTDSGLAPDAVPDRRYAAITAVNWTYLVDAFDLDAFLRRSADLLLPGGYLLLDAIDRAFDAHPKQRWLTSDWNLPEGERRPSEYRHRYARADVVAAAAAHGLDVVGEFRRDQEVPKACYVLQRPRRPQVLFVVDAPAWAHDHKTRNLIRCLRDRFDGRVVYQDALTAADLDDADAIVVWYWRQLQSLEGLGEALARNRSKLAMGVCSHNELEGALRAPGLAVLRRLPRLVFTHSALLEEEVRPLLPDSAPWCLPNGVDASFFTPRATPRRGGPLRVGWAGSLDNFGADMRGVSTVIEPALAMLQAQHPGAFELVLAAREQRVRSHEEMRDFYRDLDVYVCASRVEGTPNPALEAAACGVPVVSTRVGNMPELIEHGRNGLLVERTPQALAAALLLLHGRPELRAAMARDLRATIERSWDWRARAVGFAALLTEVLSPAEALQEVC